MYPKIEDRDWGPSIAAPFPTDFDGSPQKITKKEILQKAIEALEYEAGCSSKLTALFCIIPLIFLLFAIAMKAPWLLIGVVIGGLFSCLFIYIHIDSEKEHQEIKDNATVENLSFVIKPCTDKIAGINSKADDIHESFQLSFMDGPFAEHYCVKENVYEKTNIGDNFAFCYIGNKLVAAYPLTMWEIEGLDMTTKE